MQNDAMAAGQSSNNTRPELPFKRVSAPERLRAGLQPGTVVSIDATMQQVAHSITQLCFTNTVNYHKRY